MITINGYYGTANPCEIFVYVSGGLSCYAVSGSQQINITTETLDEGINVEAVQDVYTIFYPSGIHSLDDLVFAVELSITVTTLPITH